MQGHLEAQFLQPSNQSLLDGLPIALLEVVASQFLIALLIAQDMMDDHQDGVPHGDHGLLGTNAPSKPAVLGRQIRVLDMG